MTEKVRRVKNHIIHNDFWFMGLALEQAEQAFSEDEVPVGAIVVSPDGRAVSMAHNLKESSSRPLDHAEILALNLAGEGQKSWRLDGHTLYVTLEPCPMCLSAMVHARISRLVFGAYDFKGGSLSLGFNFHSYSPLNHHFAVTGGVRHYDCSKILSEFFRLKRSSSKL